MCCRSVRLPCRGAKTLLFHNSDFQWTLKIWRPPKAAYILELRRSRIFTMPRSSLKDRPSLSKLALHMAESKRSQSHPPYLDPNLGPNASEVFRPLHRTAVFPLISLAVCVGSGNLAQPAHGVHIIWYPHVEPMRIRCGPIGRSGPQAIQVFFEAGCSRETASLGFVSCDLLAHMKRRKPRSTSHWKPVAIFVDPWAPCWPTRVTRDISHTRQ